MTTELVPKNFHWKRGEKGFTLLEVMIVTVIIAILSAIALPAYDDYVKRGRITEGLVPLADMQARMEQYFQDHRKYEGACEANTVAPKPADTDFFAYNCSPNTDGYSIKAVGKGSMVGFAYELSLSGGVVSRVTHSLPSDWGTPGTTCWSRAKGGAC